jgi:hypothetical protein
MIKQWLKQFKELARLWGLRKAFGVMYLPL